VIKLHVKAIEMAGTGFLQVVQIFAYLLYFKPKLLLVDEPDAHLHPSRQQALIRALGEATTDFPDTQIVFPPFASPSFGRFPIAPRLTGSPMEG
jgi:predicted ATPase